nr:hypothetical protein [Friedmanniella luteola]
MTTRTEGSSRCSIAIASIPDIVVIWTSIKTMSGRSAATASTTSTPSAHSPTTSKSALSPIRLTRQPRKNA